MSKYILFFCSALLFSGGGCLANTESSDSDFFLSVGPFWSSDLYSEDYKGKDYGTKYGIGYMFQTTSTFQWGLSAAWWDIPDIKTITLDKNPKHKISLFYDTLIRGDYLSILLEGRKKLNTHLSGIVQLGGVYSRVDTFSTGFYRDNPLSSILFPNVEEPVEVSNRSTGVDFEGAFGLSWSFYPPTTSVSWFRKSEFLILFVRSTGRLYQNSIDIGARVYF